jgi:predicted esterase
MHTSAQVALELALRYSGARRLGGVVAVSASLLPETLRALRAAPPPLPLLPPPHTPVLLTHGDADGVLPGADVRASAAALRAAAPGCGADVHAVRGKGHAMPRDEAEMRVLMTFWAHTLRAAPPPAEATGDGGEDEDATLVELSLGGAVA